MVFLLPLNRRNSSYWRCQFIRYSIKGYMCFVILLFRGFHSMYDTIISKANSIQVGIVDYILIEKKLCSRNWTGLGQLSYLLYYKIFLFSQEQWCYLRAEAENQKRSCNIVEKTIGAVLPNYASIIFCDHTIDVLFILCIAGHNNYQT